jgi:hypothetical protein
VYIYYDRALKGQMTITILLFQELKMLHLVARLVVTLLLLMDKVNIAVVMASSSGKSYNNISDMGKFKAHPKS